MSITDDGKSLYCLGERRHSFDFSSKGYVNDFGEPYYDPRGIVKETLSYRGVYSYDIVCAEDAGIYSSFITYDGKSVPLVSNYRFTIDASRHGFVYYRQYGNNGNEWYPIASGESLKNVLLASGLYEICEFGDGYATYLVYVDKDAPVISYSITVDGVSQTGYITAETSGGTLRASSFTVNSLVDSVLGGFPTERDKWAYFYILYNSLGGGEHAFMTMNDLNARTYSLTTGIYKIYASDRLGNSVVQTIKINTEDIKVTASVGTSGLTVTSNRVSGDIIPGSFKVYRDNMLLTGVSYAPSMTFTESGIYRVELEDIYGNIVEKTFSFRRDLPTVGFYRERVAGTGRYEQIAVNSEDVNNLSQVISEDNQLYTVSTSANIRISYAIKQFYLV